MAQLEIVTERMKIVEFEMKHITTEYISWLNDKNLMKYSEQRRRSHTFESSSSYLLSFKNSSNMFIALENLEGDLLGTITIFHDLNNSIIDMGILIGAKNSRGKGFGAEAWKAVTNWVILNLRPRK